MRAITVPPASDFHIDMDDYLDPFIPKSVLHRLPRPVSRFLGYADAPKPEVGNLLICLWSFVGSFCGILLVSGVFRTPGIQRYHPPTIMASFGASAILEYNVIKSPLGQPRNSILGHTLSAITGVVVCKLFLLSSDYDELRWVCGAVACALASCVMTMTNTLHPPGGATAVLAAVDPTVVAMGWHLVPIIVLGSTLMLAVAMVVMNIQRQFPIYWWSGGECGSFWARERGGGVTPRDSPATGIHADDDRSSRSSRSSGGSTAAGVMETEDTLEAQKDDISEKGRRDDYFHESSSDSSRSEYARSSSTGLSPVLSAADRAAEMV